MTPKKKQFILRQINALINQDRASHDNVKKLFNQVLDESELLIANSSFQNESDLLKTLIDLKAIDIDQQLLTTIQAKQNKPRFNEGLSKVVEFETKLNQIGQVFKTRLTAGLSYALWLLVIAGSVFSTLSGVVLQFESIYDGFGAELPLATQLIIKWMNSFFHPSYFVVVFVLFFGFILYAIRRFDLNPQHNKVIRNLPFLRKLVQYLNSLKSLYYLRALLLIGFTFENALSHLRDSKTVNKRINKLTLSELNNANSLETLEEELNFQIEQLELSGDTVVTNSSRNFIALFMVFILAFIVLILFSVYLPIFQMGTVI